MKIAYILSLAVLLAGVYVNTVDRDALAISVGPPAPAGARETGFRREKGIPFVWDSMADVQVRTYKDPPGDPFEVRHQVVLCADIGIFLAVSLAIVGIRVRNPRKRYRYRLR